MSLWLPMLPLRWMASICPSNEDTLLSMSLRRAPSVGNEGKVDLIWNSHWNFHLARSYDDLCDCSLLEAQSSAIHLWIDLCASSTPLASDSVLLRESHLSETQLSLSSSDMSSTSIGGGTCDKLCRSGPLCAPQLDVCRL